MASLRNNSECHPDKIVASGDRLTVVDSAVIADRPRTYWQFINIFQQGYVLETVFLTFERTSDPGAYPETEDDELSHESVELESPEKDLMTKEKIKPKLVFGSNTAGSTNGGGISESNGSVENMDIKLTDTFECPECLYLKSLAAVGFAQGPCGSCRSNPRPVLPPALAGWLARGRLVGCGSRASVSLQHTTHPCQPLPPPPNSLPKAGERE